MTLYEAILLGIVQGVFMFFPVSSTAHMTLLEHWLIAGGSLMADPDSPEAIFFKLLVHVGTVVSIVVVFRRRLAGLLKRLWVDLRRLADRGWGEAGELLYLRLVLLGLFSVFVTGAVGMPLEKLGLFERVFAHPLMIALTLAVTGVLLYWTDKVGPRRRGLRQLTVLVALVIGLAQCLALAPGFSRSGLTIALALFMGLKRRWAAEFSFFIAIPTILAATLVWGVDLARQGTLPIDQALPYITGFLVAAGVGIVALKLVLALLYRARFRYFAYYVWALALVVAGASLWGTI